MQTRYVMDVRMSRVVLWHKSWGLRAGRRMLDYNRDNVHLYTGFSAELRYLFLMYVNARRRRDEKLGVQIQLTPKTQESHLLSKAQESLEVTSKYLGFQYFDKVQR